MKAKDWKFDKYLPDAEDVEAQSERELSIFCAGFNNKKGRGMKLGIVGSRTFNDYDKLKQVLSEKLPFVLISGGAEGADSLAERFADENKLEKVIHLPNWNGEGKAAGFIRNARIVEDCDELVAFWDGVSRGTRDTIRKARKKGISVTIVNF